MEALDDTASLTSSVTLCLGISFALLTSKELFMNHVRTSKYSITIQSVEESGFQGKVNIFKRVFK